MKQILLHLKKEWYKYGLETLVVIVGVLIAFSLNNWNEARKTEVNKDQLLESLITEYEYNLAALNVTSFVDSMLQQNIVKLLGRMNSGNNDSANFLVGGTLLNQTFDPVNGALRSAITSGDIHLINNKDLLASLFAWEDLISDMNEEQLLLKNEQWEMMDKFTDYYRVSDAISEFAEYLQPEVIGSWPGSKFESENTLLSNPEFESSLYKRLHLVYSKSNEMKIVIEANQKILELLKEESK